MIFTANTTTGGWLDKKTLKTGDVLKLVSEAIEVPSNQGGMQIVAKCRVRGQAGEPTNISINKPSKNALISAFGDDSVNWTEKHLTVHVEKTIIAGKRGLACYLIPDGYEVTEDDGGYVVVTKIGAKTNVVTKEKDEDTIEYPDEKIDPNDIPF
jgi:hypothetical protein